MRVVSLHSDVLVATSRIWQTTCTIVRGRVAATGAGASGAGPSGLLTVHLSGGGAGSGGTGSGKAGSGKAGSGEAGSGKTGSGGTGSEEAGSGGTGSDMGAGPGAETFVIDSPILPDELEILPALLDQARFPAPSGLLATHADWDHLLARLAFPDATLGCAVSSAERIRSTPGAPQRELRSFDEQYYVSRSTPLALGATQALDVPGGCEIGERELALHPAEGHTADGMAVWIGWAGVLVAGDYLSTVEIPVLGEGGSIDAYLATLERLRPLVSGAAHVVPGHGPVLDSERALTVLEEDVAYLRALRDGGATDLPDSRRTKAQRRIHAENVDIARGRI